MLLQLLIKESISVGKFVKETAREIGGELVKISITSLAEAAIDKILDSDDESDDESEEKDWFWWLSGKELKYKFRNETSCDLHSYVFNSKHSSRQK